MTKVLLITNTTDFTTDYVVRELKLMGADYYRFNTDEIGNSVFLSFDFEHELFTLYDKPKGLSLDLLSFKSVYFRRPEIHLNSVEDLTADEKHFVGLEICQTLEGLYKILRKAFWISDVDSIRRAENKVYQQIIAKEIGLKIAKGIITNQAEPFNAFVRDSGNACIVKPIYSGQIGWHEMHDVVFTSELTELPSDKQIEISPTYLQEQLEKKFDVRVTVVGEEIFAVRIDSQSNNETKTDWRRGENILPHEIITLPDHIRMQCITLLQKLDLRFGAIDFVENNEGEYVFLEINPNGQWAWIETLTGLPIANAIAKLLKNECNAFLP